MAATTHDPMPGLAAAQSMRLRIAAIRRRALDREITLAEIMADPPSELAHWACVDVIRLTRVQGLKRSTAGLERLGRLAIRDGINLLMPLGRSSATTREWIAEHAGWYVTQPNGGKPVAFGPAKRRAA